MHAPLFLLSAKAVSAAVPNQVPFGTMGLALDEPGRRHILKLQAPLNLAPK